MVRLLLALAIFVSANIAASAQSDAPATAVPIICPDLTVGPCSPVERVGVVIGVNQKFLDCLKEERDDPNKCLGTFTTEFDWLQDAQVIALSEPGVSSPYMLDLNDYLTQSPAEVEWSAARGIVIPEYCLRADTLGEFVQGAGHECEGPRGALNSLGIDLVAIDAN